MTCGFQSLLVMSEPTIWLRQHAFTPCSSNVGGACCTCLHVSQWPIRLVMSLSIPGQYAVDLALALHLEIPQCPVWRNLRYSLCNNFGITTLVPFMTTPPMMLKFHLCIQNAWRSGSISAYWSGHPVWTTLANLTNVKSLLVSHLIWLILPSWNILIAATMTLIVLSSNADSSWTLQLKQSATGTPSCFT